MIFILLFEWIGIEILAMEEGGERFEFRQVPYPYFCPLMLWSLEVNEN